MDDGSFPIIIFWIFIGAAIGGLIGASRNNAGGGALLGALLGPIGWLLVLLFDHRVKCPACQNPIPDGAKICGHCRLDLFAPKPRPSGVESVALTETAVEPKRKKCPFCAELIQQEAIKCRYCGSDLTSELPPNEVVTDGPVESIIESSEMAPHPLPERSHIDFDMMGNARVSCPLCRKQIRAGSLKQGENFCPHCFEKFNVE